MKPIAKAPDVQQSLKNSQLDILKLLELSAPEATNPSRYFCWDELRYRSSPEGLNSQTWWAGVKIHRQLGRLSIPLTDSKGQHFSYSLMPQILDLLHDIDLLCGMLPGAGKAKPKPYYSSIIDESIMSSVLEGAAVTRAEAKEMLRQNRAPLNAHERMVRNNYQTMKYLLHKQGEPLTPELVLEIHRQMTEDTLEAPEKSGCLRSEDDHVRVEHSVTGEIIHTPPPAAELPARMELMCAFANAEGAYVHPVLRAILLHFWLAYDHPFVDGNGRTARALFYWAMLKGGYSLVEYISISQEIDSHPKRYYLSFQKTETDDRDLNYFIFDQLHTLADAIRNLTRAIQQEDEVLYAGESLPGFEAMDDLNPRQKAFLQQLAQLPHKASFSITAYCDEFKVVRQTARTDLGALVSAGILTCRKQGKQFLYSASPEYRSLL